jgi:hypothetical protein
MRIVSGAGGRGAQLSEPHGDMTPAHLLFRIFRVLLISALLLILVGCGGSGSGSNPTTPPQTPTPTPTPTPDTTNQWTWVGGPNLVNQPGNYGTLGQSTAANLPSAPKP